MGVKKQILCARGREGGGGGGGAPLKKWKKKKILCALHRKEKVCIDEHHMFKHISPHKNYQRSVENLCWINYIRNLYPNCQYSCSSCSSSSEIVAKSLPPPQNLCRPLKKIACVSVRYRKHCGGGVGGWQ